MSKPTRRQGSAVYYARRVVPKTLQAIYGRREIWKSLGTKECAEAKPLERQAQLAWDQEFAAASAKLGAENAAPVPNTSPFLSREHEEGAEELARMLDEEEAALQADPILRAKVQHAKMLQSEVWDRQFAAELKEEARAERAAAEPAGKGTRLGTVVERWASENKPTPKTVDRMSAVVAWFEDFLGRLPVEAITPEHVLTFRDKLLAKTSASNARMKLRNFRTLMQTCVPRIIAANPATGIAVNVKVAPQDRRREFEPDALAAIFNSPVYREHLRPAGGAGEAAYWLPLLGLYTGARLNELAQLRPSDILQAPYIDDDDTDQTVWAIRITADDGAGLRLKNAGSERRVPIHADLIALGFLDYAAKANGQDRLFPALRPDKYGTISASWSKWFNRYLRDPCGLTDSRLVFHSFRHSFKHYARAARIPKDVHDAITGHKGGDVGDDYGPNYPLAPLVEGMKRYRVPGFKLPAPPPGLKS